MSAPAIRTEEAPAQASARRWINPVTGYALAITGSVAFWALLLSAIF